MDLSTLKISPSDINITNNFSKLYPVKAFEQLEDSVQYLNDKNKELTFLHKEVEEQRDKLNELLNHQRKLLTILAHDTSGPLDSMRQLLKLYTANKIPEQVSQDVFPMMINQLDITLSLIDNIRNWGASYLEKESENVAIDVNLVVKEAFEPFRQIAKGKKITFLNLVDDHAKLNIHQDTLNFIIRNLLNNSVKYTEKGIITVSAKSVGKTYQIFVTDTGIGMPDHIAKNLFVSRAFTRNGTRNEQGSGLGLMLIVDFIKQANGRISFTSTEGKGTTFIIELPL